MLEDLYTKNSLIPKRYLSNISLQPATIDEVTFKELNDIRNNVNTFVSNGDNLLICSNNVGCGKTTWATKILKEYIKVSSNIKFKNECPALFINVTNFLNEKKLAIGNQELMSKVNDIEMKILTAKLVVFDDLGVKDLSDYDMGNLYYWIDSRTNNCLSSIYTSNLMPEQLQKILDDRIFSRVVNYSIIKEIKDGDNRGVNK